MSSLNILVCGAGLAGSTLAFWLARSGHQVKLIERAPSLRNSGLGIDVRGQAVEVLRRMNVLEEVRSRTTGEEGLAFVDTKDHTFAFFGIFDEENLENSPTSEIEIMRSDLADIVTKAALAQPGVEVLFDTEVEALVQNEQKVNVRLTTGEEISFDLVVAADGLSSHTRKLFLSTSVGSDVNSANPINSLGQYTAYFSLPREPQDGKVWKWYNSIGRRVLSTRPKTSTTSAAYLTIMPSPSFPPAANVSFKDLMRRSVSEQKESLARMFADAGWQAPRLIKAMFEADDFYLQHIAQVKLPVWHWGRCAVVGDAAYCPSPLSGVGTSLALLGAYVLATEIAKLKSPATPNTKSGDEDLNADLEAALVAYEKKLRPFVLEKQSLPPGVPKIASPETAFGVAVLQWVVIGIAWAVWLVRKSGVTKIFTRKGGNKKDDVFSLDNYGI